ncbi:MAG: ATP-dependent Clp protease adaptor ClpS [Candidatus Sumerlaeia bacterium]|nr:ATP-dependent Clp protease adaptor ClpS [Candidatus Sumerlaeia bacterium]
MPEKESPLPLLEQETGAEVKPQRGWVVVVYNDDHHTFIYVIMVFCAILQVSAEDANRLATTIHTKGEAVVAGPMSKYEAVEISQKIASFGPDPFSMKPTTNIGLKTSIKEA